MLPFWHKTATPTCIHSATTVIHKREALPAQPAKYTHCCQAASPQRATHCAPPTATFLLPNSIDPPAAGKWEMGTDNFPYSQNSGVLFVFLWCWPTPYHCLCQCHSHSQCLCPFALYVVCWFHQCMARFCSIAASAIRRVGSGSPMSMQFTVHTASNIKKGIPTNFVKCIKLSRVVQVLQQRPLINPTNIHICFYR